IYIRNEKMCNWYIDPAEELRKIDEYINEENISSEERKTREGFKKAYLTINKKRIENGKFYKFDKELCKLKFAESQKRLIKLYNGLPKYIVDKIADIRVFALGYTSGEVKRLLRPYCTQLQRTVKEITLNANAVTCEAENHLTAKIGLDFWGIGAIEKLTEQDGDIYLYCVNHYFVIKNGKITEGQCKPVYPYFSEKPNCPTSRVVAEELHHTEDKFELNLLMCNLDELEREDLWYLTIIGTDILKFEESNFN
ncbi:MAG: DUF4085 family protein, partial [Clostridia bacterium]|nr:DUF4085 family protein [Clostridia bacterium]